MVEYEPFDEGVEARGRVIIAIEEGINHFRDAHRETVQDVLAAKGIEDPNPDDWYAQAAELDVLATIAEEFGRHVLDRLGEWIPDVARWPSGVSGVADGLRSIDEAYRRNHRGGDIGHCRFERIGDGHGRVECRSRYPCPFDRGLIRAVAKDHSPVESFVFVEEPGRTCRRDGDGQCTDTVCW